MTRAYASTEVDYQKSRDQTERIIQRGGGTRVSWLSLDDNEDRLVFWLSGRWISFPVRWAPADKAPRGSRDPLTWSEQDRRRAYRLTLQRVKLKFEELAEEPERLLETFAAHLLMADGRTGVELITEAIGEPVPSNTPPRMSSRGAIALPMGGSRG